MPYIWQYAAGEDDYRLYPKEGQEHISKALHQRRPEKIIWWLNVYFSERLGNEQRHWYKIDLENLWQQRFESGRWRKIRAFWADSIDPYNDYTDELINPRWFQWASDSPYLKYLHWDVRRRLHPDEHEHELDTQPQHQAQAGEPVQDWRVWNPNSGHPWSAYTFCTVIHKYVLKETMTRELMFGPRPDEATQRFLADCSISPRLPPPTDPENLQQETYSDPPPAWTTDQSTLKYSWDGQPLPKRQWTTEARNSPSEAQLLFAPR